MRDDKWRIGATVFYAGKYRGSKAWGIYYRQYIGRRGSWRRYRNKSNGHEWTENGLGLSLRLDPLAAICCQLRWVTAEKDVWELCDLYVWYANGLSAIWRPKV